MCAKEQKEAESKKKAKDTPKAKSNPPPFPKETDPAEYFPEDSSFLKSLRQATPYIPKSSKTVQSKVFQNFSTSEASEKGTRDPGVKTQGPSDPTPKSLSNSRIDHQTPVTPKTSPLTKQMTPLPSIPLPEPPAPPKAIASEETSLLPNIVLSAEPPAPPKNTTSSEVPSVEEPSIPILTDDAEENNVGSISIESHDTLVENDSNTSSINWEAVLKQSNNLGKYIDQILESLTDRAAATEEVPKDTIVEQMNAIRSKIEHYFGLTFPIIVQTESLSNFQIILTVMEYVKHLRENFFPNYHYCNACKQLFAFYYKVPVPPCPICGGLLQPKSPELKKVQNQ